MSPLTRLVYIGGSRASVVLKGLFQRAGILSYASVARSRRQQLLEQLQQNTVRPRYKSRPQEAAVSATPQNTGLEWIMSHSVLVIGRQYEMLNILAGFEQCNRYVIYNAQGQPLGYIIEEGGGIVGSIVRQIMRGHRPIRAQILDLQGKPLMMVQRPFKLINSRMTVSMAQETEQILGEVHQEWHLFRRMYSLFLEKRQFARIDAPILSWEFNVENEEGQNLATISRNFTHLLREVFTDSGQYLVSFGSTGAAEYDARWRSVILGCAISIDMDYFSRHSSHLPHTVI